MNNPIIERKKKRFGGQWDGVWGQKSTSKRLNFLRKIGYFYIDFTGLLSKYLNKFQKTGKNYSIIELGCGGSSYLPYLKKKYNNLQLFGIDKSLRGCILTTKGIDGGHSSSNIVCGDIFKCPLKSKTFDIVFSVGLIEHFDEPNKVLEKHVELLKPDGLLICIIPNISGLQGKFFKLKIFQTEDLALRYPDDWIWGMKPISMKDLECWFTDAGLDDVEVSPIGGINPMLIMESYNSDKNYLSIKLMNFIYRYILFLPFIAINIPFLYKYNSITYSPFIIAVGKNKNNIKK
jgi:SAM-dependent methyltransferase